MCFYYYSSGCFCWCFSSSPGCDQQTQGHPTSRLHARYAARYGPRCVCLCVSVCVCVCMCVRVKIGVFLSVLCSGPSSMSSLAQFRTRTGTGSHTIKSQTTQRATPICTNRHQVELLFKCMLSSCFSAGASRPTISDSCQGTLRTE